MQKIISNMRMARMAIMLIIALLSVQTVQAETNTTALATAISEAEEYLGSIKESNPNEAQVLQIVVDAAKQVQNDSHYSQSDVDFATAVMKEVTIQAKNAVATGVNAVRATADLVGKYYDLQGRRIAQPAQGVYINGGKKLVMK